MNITGLLLHAIAADRQANEGHLLLVKSMAHVVQHFYLHWTTSFVLMLYCGCMADCYTQNDFLARLIPNWGMSPVQIVQIAGYKQRQHIGGQRYYNLILVSSSHAFFELDVISHTKDYTFNELYYICLQMSPAPTAQQLEIQSILEYCWAHQLINCNVQVQMQGGEILVYTYFPFTPHHCRRVVPVLVNRFVGNKFAMDTLFPKKLHNFYGCPLRVALWHVPPYMYLSEDGKGRTTNIVGGLEGVLLQELAKSLNFRIEVLVPPNNEHRGRINGTILTGALGMLRNRSVDLALGAFRESAERLLVASATNNYYQSYQVLYVLDSAFKFTSLEVLLFPFQRGTWLTLLLFVCFTGFVVAAVNRYHRHWPHLFPNYTRTHSYLNVLLVLLGMSVPGDLSTRSHKRLYWTALMLGSLVVRTTYQALLFHFIRSDLSKPLPLTGDALLDANYTVVFNRGTYDTMWLVPFIAGMRQVIIDSSVETVAAEYLQQQRLSGQRLVAASPLDFLLIYRRENRNASAFIVVPEYVITLSFTIYLAKHSYLVEQLDEKIVWLRDMGLVYAWADWELGGQAAAVAQTPGSSGVFGLDELHMIFVLGLLALSVALLTFVLELLSQRLHWLRRLFVLI